MAHGVVLYVGEKRYQILREGRYIWGDTTRLKIIFGIESRVRLSLSFIVGGGGSVVWKGKYCCFPLWFVLSYENRISTPFTPESRKGVYAIRSTKAQRLDN